MSLMTGQSAARRTRQGIVYMVLASLLFATGGLVLKWTDWNSLAVNGIRSLFGAVIIGGFMWGTKRRLVLNKTVLLGAVSYAVMTTLFVAANKMTAAGNVIVLQYTCPLWIMLLGFVFFHRKPTRREVLAIVFIGAGILCFFCDSLSSGHVAGDVLALLSGLFYGVLFMINSMQGGDALSSVFLGQIVGFLCFSPFSFSCSWDLTNVLAIVWLGAFQVGFAYLFFSLGTALISPLQASLVSGLEPVLNPLLVAAFGFEQLTGLSLLGAAIVILSVLWYSLSAEKKAKKGTESVLADRPECPAPACSTEI